jgi:hypothetical protein
MVVEQVGLQLDGDYRLATAHAHAAHADLFKEGDVALLPRERRAFGDVGGSGRRRQ